MKIKLPDGRIIPYSRDVIRKQVIDELVKEGFLIEEKRVMSEKKAATGTLQKGELKRFNNVQNEANEEYVIEELKVQLSGYTEGEKLTKKGVIALFDAIRKYAEANKYYVGITCDPNRREGEHKAEFLAIIACPDKDKANDLEMTLDGKGYDAGDAVGNVHKVQSKKVYIYKKTSQTIE